MTEKTIHEGRNVKRFREMLGMKQEALADALGDDWNQKKISLLEARKRLSFRYWKKLQGFSKYLQMQ